MKWQTARLRKQNSCLPIIALLFGFAPVILWLLGWIHDFFWILFFGSMWGIGFQVIGLLLGIISLCKRKKGTDVSGLIFSIIAILSPFIWVVVT